MSDSLRALVARCTVTEFLTDDEWAAIENEPDILHDQGRHVRCEYEVGHDGPHATLGMTVSREGAPLADSYDVWLQWADELRRFERVEFCPLEAHPDDDVACALPLGHAGAHEQEIAKV